MKFEVKLKPGESEERLFKIAAQKVPGCKYVRILKKSLDARNKADIRWLYSVEAERSAPPKEEKKIPQVTRQPRRVVVVGSGPAGLFCALRLLRGGIRPVLVERGGTVEERVLSYEHFFKSKVLDEECNIQFGEGGAGTFSDGKLNTQTKDPRNRDVLETFARFGAPEEILWLNKPHMGSDILRKVVVSMRKYILEQGGQVLFHTRFEGVTVSGGELREVRLRNLQSGEEYALPASEVVLAVGHSSRDTFRRLRDAGFAMQAREFAVGVRIEHLQEKISYAQYSAAHTLLPPADYKLISHASDRNVFTFCMCPGGVVVPASSEAGGVVTNGMSNYARDEKNANSALLVQIRLSDFDSSDILGGVEFQRKIERAAYELGGRTYAAPVQRAEDFLKKRASVRMGEVVPSYAAGTVPEDLDKIFPSYVSDALRAAIMDMDRRLKGFAHPDAVLTGAETRFSSPVRILRGENGESVNFGGVYPCGEGCGYSGGITSSAADGIRTAELICEKYL